MSSRSFKRRLASSMSFVAMAGSLTFAAPALAQGAPAAEEANAADTIVVTARKREEDILKTPVTITAVTSEDISARGIVSMHDLAASTPGININNSSSGHADRAFQQVIVRGFTPSTTLATTTSLFIDGVPVSSPSAFTAISDPERIEILKGPQSAFYGRSTFAGAINVVNKTPGNDWHGSILGMAGTRSNYRGRAEVEGAIIPDVLMVRASGEYFSKHGSWTNTFNGTTLGDESSATGTALIVFKPAAGLTLKAFGMIGQDKDGAPAQTRLYAYDVKNTAGQILLQNQANCTFPGNTTGGSNGVTPAVPNSYICGTVPMFINPLAANNINDGITTAFLSGNDAGRVIPYADGVKGYGLLRHTRHFHFTADYEFNNHLSLSLLAGLNREEWSTFIDLDGFDGSSIPRTGTATTRAFYDFPFMVERTVRDTSFEGRLNYNFGALHGVAGASYLKSTLTSGGGGSPAGFAPGGPSVSKTLGFFLGATYDFTPEFSVSFEGRYQTDKLFALTRASGQTIAAGSPYIASGVYAPGSILAQSEYKNFMPRIIANYQINPDLMVYASWAKGVNPGQFNTNILTFSVPVQQFAANNGGTLGIRPEKITNYEIGLKGKALDGRLRFSLAAYYAQWRDQINAVAIVVPDPTQLTGFTFVNTSANAGSADLKGIEFESTWRVSDLVTLNAAAAINDSSIKDFVNVTVSKLTGSFDYAGKQMANTSKYSANLGIQFGGAVNGWDDGNWFFRTDYSYKSGVYSNQQNTSKTAARNVVNLRAGISKGPFSLEAFVKNVFNDKNYTSLTDNFIFTPNFAFFGTDSALLVGLPELRTAGVQLKVKF